MHESQHKTFKTKAAHDKLRISQRRQHAGTGGGGASCNAALKPVHEEKQDGKHAPAAWDEFLEHV